MSVDTPETDLTADDVESLGAELGNAIADLPEYRIFERKSAAVEESPKAQERIQAFEQQRQEFMLARQTGDAGQDDVRALQQAQEDLHSMPVMAEFLEAREELVETLETVNRAISDPLSLDFGKEAGGCCQDD
jgi:cell fate (sporulation/competence/biofilm development) regulator YlbF (YheA/YmcA/DUF963 family)